MERLTRKRNNTYFYNVDDVFVVGKRLGAFEDFMEENEWDSIEEMKSALNQCEQKYFKMQRDYEELKHCIWKDTPIEQIRNNYERGHNFDFVGVAYNRGKAKIDRKVRQENQALKERWQKLKEFVYQYTSLAKECQSDSQASRMAQANKIYAKMEQMEEEE